MQKLRFLCMIYVIIYAFLLQLTLGKGIMNTVKDEKLNSKPHKLSACQKVYRFFKGVLDFLMALIACILLTPLFIIVAIAIKVDSKGPVFFTQKRIGYKGKEFKCVKFRSMAQDANHEVAGYEYAEVSSYITKVGKVIRKLSIDELPQIFNILLFQMSWIGLKPIQLI